MRPRRRTAIWSMRKPAFTAKLRRGASPATTSFAPCGATAPPMRSLSRSPTSAASGPSSRSTQALSDFADASVRGGVNLLLTEAAGTGRIILKNPDDPGPGSGFVVLALGKHGAGELNYSSDIDLVVFFDSAAPTLREGVEPDAVLRPPRPAVRPDCCRSAPRTATSTASTIACGPTPARRLSRSRCLRPTPITKRWARTGSAPR